MAGSLHLADSTGWRRRAAGMGRAALALTALFGTSGVLHACLIEERTYLAECDEYCDGVMEKCRTRPVYPNREACQATCATLGTSSIGDDADGSWLSCRLDKLRRGFEESKCPQVGPGGGDVCGSNCDAFCSLRKAACGEVQSGNFDIAHPQDCERACPGLPDRPTADPTRQGSDDIQCRLSKLSEALANPDDPADACKETPLEANVEEGLYCRDDRTTHDENCETYCGVVMRACTGKNQFYESAEQCRAVCDVFADGLPSDTGYVHATPQNTVHCRRYHAFKALDRPDEHCPHAGPTGDGHCEDAPQGRGRQGNCESYCRILEASCSVRFASQYGDGGLQGCIDTCARAVEGGEARPTLVDAWMDGFASGGQQVPHRYEVGAAPTPDTPPLQCRTFYAVRARTEKYRDPLNPVDPADCASAFADPSSPCQ
jgi:hypothetical protein